MSPSQKTKTLQSLAWLVPAVVAGLLMAFAPELSLAICPRELRAANGCGVLFPAWTYWLCAAVIVGSVAKTVFAWRKAVRGEDYELDRLTGQDRYRS